MDPRIKQTQEQGPTPAELLAKMPRRPLNADQHAIALEKAQEQAAQRVKLGQQLFEAADARLKQHQRVLDEINDQQRMLREQVQDDVAKSLVTYDQWMGRIDESFTKAIRDMTQRLDQLEDRVEGSHHEMQDMLAKAGALLEQTQTILAETFGDQEEIAAAMQVSASESHDCDLDELVESVTPERIDEAEVIDVEIAGATDESGLPEVPSIEDIASEEEDVFGEVLRRLRAQADDQDGHAAA